MENSKSLPRDGFGGLTLAMVTSNPQFFQMPVPEGFSKQPTSCYWISQPQEEFTKQKSEWINQQQWENNGEEIFWDEEDYYQEQTVSPGFDCFYNSGSQTGAQQIEEYERFQKDKFQIYYEENLEDEREYHQIHSDLISDQPVVLQNMPSKRNGRRPLPRSTAFACFWCEKKLCSNWSWLRHMAGCKKVRNKPAHKKFKSSTSSNSTLGEKPQDSFLCEVCNGTFTTIWNLARHKKGKVQSKRKGPLFPQCNNDEVEIHFSANFEKPILKVVPIKMSRQFLSLNSNRFKVEIENKSKKYFFLEDITQEDFLILCAIQSGAVAVDENNYRIMKESSERYGMKLAEQRVKEFEEREKAPK